MTPLQILKAFLEGIVFVAFLIVLCAGIFILAPFVNPNR